MGVSGSTCGKRTTRIVWVAAVFLSISCTEKVIQSGSSSGPSNCDSSLNSVRPSALSLSQDKKTRVGKVQLDTATILLPAEDNSFGQLLPNNFVNKHRGFSAHRVGKNQLAAVIDHACTLASGIDSKTRERLTKLNLSANLMTAEDDALQNFHNRIRRSTRAFAVPPDTTLEELAEMADADPCITVVGNNALYKLLVPNDTYYGGTQGTTNGIGVPRSQNTANLTDMNFAAGYAKFFENVTAITTDVVIAVIDSGVRITHQDLDGNLWVNTGETNNNNIDDDSNGKIDDYYGWNFEDTSAENPAPQNWTGYDNEEGHGTHVAGIIAAEGNNNQGVLGVISAHGKIMGLNVFGDQPSSTTTDIDNAITYAANEGAKVINMSLGSEVFASTTQAAINSAVTAGAFIVAAAGNGDDSGYGLVLDSNYGVYPASLAKDINGMMSVGSHDGLTGDRSVFSNCSTTYVEISAPGAYDSTDYSNGGIPSTWHETGLGVVSTSTYTSKLAGYSIYGTSMAAPMVAGAAALAISRFNDQEGSLPTPAQVETILYSSGATATALQPYVKGGKKLDLNAIFDYILANF